MDTGQSVVPKQTTKQAVSRPEVSYPTTSLFNSDGPRRYFQVDNKLRVFYWAEGPFKRDGSPRLQCGRALLFGDCQPRAPSEQHAYVAANALLSPPAQKGDQDVHRLLDGALGREPTTLAANENDVQREPQEHRASIT